MKYFEAIKKEIKDTLKIENFDAFSNKTELKAALADENLFINLDGAQGDNLFLSLKK